MLLPFHFLYQDESGDPCRAHGDFLVGLLKVRDPEPLREAVRRVRDHYHFQNELHFSDMSALREAVYGRGFAELAQLTRLFEFHAILVRYTRLDITLCGGKRHLAYNFFTKLLLQHRCAGVERALMFSDRKARMKEDNFLEYLRTEVNLEAGRCVLKKVEPLDSKRDDLLQVADLFTGCANNLMGHASGERKVRVRECAERLGLVTRAAVWDWQPRTA